jgi:ADP-heptose:LPS heptosyltransferase
LLEGPADNEIANYLRARLEPFTPLCIVKNWRLGKLAALMTKSSLYLGNDSGISHLAAACGTPTVALFGPTDPHIWAPLGPRVKIIRWQGEGTLNATQGDAGTVLEAPPEAGIVINQANEWLRIY